MGTENKEGLKTWFFNEDKQAVKSYFHGQTITDDPHWPMVCQSMKRADFMLLAGYVTEKKPGEKLKASDFLEAKKELEKK